jgi:hypothetical protein
VSDNPVFDVPDLDLASLNNSEREELLQAEFLKQTAKMPWREMQTYYARGNVIVVSAELDLIAVAVQLGLDNSTQFAAWIEQDLIAPATDKQALAWYENDQTLWVTVAAPWVLVQHKD